MRTRRLSTLFVALSLAGCTHPASKEDCTRIVEKTVELTLRKMNRPAEDIAKQKAETTAAMGDRIQECVGKKVTSRMLSCVDKSTTLEDATECMK